MGMVSVLALSPMAKEGITQWPESKLVMLIICVKNVPSLVLDVSIRCFSISKCGIVSIIKKRIASFSGISASSVSLILSPINILFLSTVALTVVFCWALEIRAANRNKDRQMVL